MTPSLCRERGSTSAASATEHVRLALDLVHDLLVRGAAGTSTWDDRLGTLAQAFDAAGAGIAALSGPTPVFCKRAGPDGPWPWEVAPELPAQTRHATTAQVFTTAGASLLVTGACHSEDTSWLIWTEAGPDRDWSEAERAAFFLAGLALIRLAVAENGPDAGSSWPDRARIEQRLEDVAGLVARLAHDFGNVLTGIIGFTELGLLHLPAGSPAQQRIQEVYDAAQQGVQLINRLNQTCPRGPSPLAATNLAEVVAAEAGRAQTTVGPPVLVTVAVPADLPAVALEASAVRQLLAALLDNARRAAGPAGHVTVSAVLTEVTARAGLDLLGRPAPGPAIRLTVADTGPGFSAAARRRVFAEPFFSTRPRHRGMGLTTVYALLRGSGGGLRLEHGPTGGTRVHTYLPLAQSERSGVGPQ